MKPEIASVGFTGISPGESPSLDHSMIDQLPVGVFRKNAQGRYILVNLYFCRLHGREPRQFLGRTPLEIANNEPAPAVSRRLQNEIHYFNDGATHHEQIMHTGQGIEYEERYPAGDGSELFFHVIKSPVFDAGGKLAGSQGVLVDITERKRAENQLNHERNLLRVLMRLSDDFIYFKDRESRFVRGSVKLAKMFNCPTPDDLIGRSDADFFAAEHATDAYADEQRIIQTGQPVLGKMEKETWPDGHVTWALTSKWPLHDDDGSTIGTFGISKDITAIKEAEAKVERINKQLVDASRQGGMAEVATSVLHNVGNVLNSVNVSGSLIAEGLRNSKTPNLAKSVALMRAHEADLGAFFSGDPKGKQLLEYLSNLAVHLEQERADNLREVGSLMDNIVHIKDIVAMQQNYARTSGVIELLKVADLVEDAVRMNSGALNRHSVKVVQEFAAVPPILTEKHKVLQILVNLISNAKYACDGSGNAHKEITLQIAGGKDRVSISVIDNGVGIPAENLTRIFNLGYTTRKNGHGFGLHNSALAARELGGNLSVHSDGVAQGAAFLLELPLDKAKSVL